jgi:hypothetical protein
MPSFVPSNWYWLAADGRVFSSARQLVVGTTDSGYVAWTAHNTPTTWPRDAAGNQTNAALQVVLTPYNLFVDLIAYVAYVRFNKVASGIVVTSISPVRFLTDIAAINDINCAYDYSQANASQVFQWKMSDGSFVTLDKVKLGKVHNSVMPYVQSCFACEQSTTASINSGSITTQAQVNSAFAAISNVFP